MAQRALVTGGAGFIGSHVAEALLIAGDDVRVFDNLSTGSLANLKALPRPVEFVHGDIRDRASVARACAGVHVVFHLAAFISVPGSVADPVTADAVNIGGTLNVLLGARDAGVRRVIFSSSAAVYGEPEHIPVSETARTMPASPYGLEKLYGEHMCRLFTELYGLETISLRYFNVYGPRQNPNSEYAAVIPKFISAMIQGETPVIYGDGLQTRDFLYVGDVARANRLAAEALDVRQATVNIASGKGVSVLELHRILAGLADASPSVHHAPPRAGDIRHSVADTHMARRVLGFEPSVTLEEGLRRTLKWFRSCPQDPGTSG